MNGQESSLKSQVITHPWWSQKWWALGQTKLLLSFFNKNEWRFATISHGSAVIRHVECDYSLPLLGAVCQTFNEMSLSLYRKVCYEAINNRERCDSMKVLNNSIKAVVHICSNHNLHSWKLFFERKEASYLVKE